MQFIASKSSRAAKAESRNPSGKPTTKGKVKTETAKTPSDKPASKVKAESKRKAEPNEKTPQTKSDDVSKIKLEKEGTRNHFLLRTGVKRRGEGSVLFPYDPKDRDSEETCVISASTTKHHCHCVALVRRRAGRGADWTWARTVRVHVGRQDK